MDTSKQVDFQSPEYRRSRNAYTMECAFEYFVSLMISGAFLAKLLSHIGLDDALIGIISSFVSFAFLFQLGSIFIVQRLTRTKLFVVLFHTLSNLLFMSLYLIPFLPWAYEIKEGLVIFCVLAAYFGKYIENTILYRWANSYVDENFIYREGQWAIPDKFTEDRWVESTHGIHFWMTREEAIKY